MSARADVLGLAVRRARGVGPWSLLVVSLYALASALVATGLPGLAADDGAVLAASLLIESVVVYRLVADIAGWPMAAGALAWFVAGSLLSLLPLLALLVLAWWPALSGDASAMLLMIGAVAAFACVMLLQAWPVAMAARRGRVSPLRILRATRGHRRHLLFAMIPLAVLNGATEMTWASGPALFVVHFAAMMLQTLLLGGLASAAYDAACANDPGLRGNAIPD